MDNFRYKFRGKRVDTGDWLYGNLVIDIMGNSEIWDFANHESDSYTQKPVISETVGQFTGLKDKNGKEIYEGDIIKSKNMQQSHNGYIIHPIEWDSIKCGWNCNQDAVNSFEMAVIGNIYETFNT